MHVIFNYKGNNLLTKKEIRCKDDVFTHLYTLIVNPDGTYEVLIDNEKAESGTLEEDWDFLPPKEIKDPEAKKPEDLYIGMVLPGLVTNITKFGCFVDIGLKESGLVHISQLKAGFVSDVNEVVKLHQHITVKVTEVDEERKRIQLTMII